MTTKTTKTANKAPCKAPSSERMAEAFEAVRVSGLTNMFDRPQVIALMGEFGFTDCKRWLTANPREFGPLLMRKSTALQSAVS